MEKKLSKLFDYQRFDPSSRLAKLINETESRYARALSDDDLYFVNAAATDFPSPSIQDPFDAADPNKPNP